MFDKVLGKIFGTKHERDVRRLMPLVEEINQIYEGLRRLSDEQLSAKTEEFKQRLREGETLDDLLPEAYAVVKEVCRRLLDKSWTVCGLRITWDMVPFDVQLMGAVVLHEGKIAEMATGEGKTLVATMPLYLNALTERGVHLVTVNDYLARRDREWMGPIYEFLGLTVGCLQNQMGYEERKIAYAADITYGTNNEFGFDYLRDNMAIRQEDRVQRGHYYAIVDEVDSVLIDEARTPLIISGPVGESTHRYRELKPLVERLVREQTRLVNQIVAEAKNLLDEDREYEAGFKLLQAQRGAPKNKQLLKLQKEPGVKKLISGIEGEFMRDKRMGEVDEDLFYAIDEKANTIDLTDKGRKFLSPHDPDLFVLPDLSEELHRIDTDQRLSLDEKEKKKAKLYKLYGERSEKIHNISQLLRAYSLFERDVEYVVSDGKVIIVDEFTGRLMPGRRYSDGLHQALEAKEGVRIEGETQTLATITLQNYFRLYEKLAGMTGTAETEAAEFFQIYKLDVVVIPTNEPVRRIDYPDRIYRTRREKYNAVIDEITDLHRQGRPVLVGTVSVDVSETLSRMLKRKGIKHSVLNAKYHQQEAEIIAQAGQAGAVTIATNMAGRGTDIKLGPGVVKCQKCCIICEDEDCDRCEKEQKMVECFEEVPCGLHIVGTERHEARRIDRQLRGRSGRQGDPGSSQFYLSLEDDLMRLFGSDRIAGVMDRLGVEEGEVIQHPLVTRAIEQAQKRVETYNFDIRKHLLEYDDVMNQQREIIYTRRSQALAGEDLRDEIVEMIKDTVAAKVEDYVDPRGHPEEWDLEGLRRELLRLFLVDLSLDPDEIAHLKSDELHDRVEELVLKAYERREEALGPEVMRHLERMALLSVIDERWREHLYELDQLREGIGLRAYGQKDPLIEYKQEAFDTFMGLLDRLNEEVLELLFRIELVEEPALAPRGVPAQVHAVHQSTVGMGFEGGERAAPVTDREPAPRKQRPVKAAKKVGRNDPCPCGSGKKYKKCCGRY